MTLDDATLAAALYPDTAARSVPAGDADWTQHVKPDAPPVNAQPTAPAPTDGFAQRLYPVETPPAAEPAAEQPAEPPAAAAADAEPEPAAPPTPETVRAAADPEVLGVFESTAADLGLDANMQEQLLLQVAPVMQARAAAMAEQAREAWRAEALADAELLAGDGLESNLQLASGVLREFGDERLQEALLGALGDYPPLIRLAARIGKALQQARAAAATPEARADAYATAFYRKQ